MSPIDVIGVAVALSMVAGAVYLAASRRSGWRALLGMAAGVAAATLASLLRRSPAARPDTTDPLADLPTEEADHGEAEAGQVLAAELAELAAVASISDDDERREALASAVNRR